MNEYIKKQFPILDKKINSKRLVYLDSAATSLKPKQVIDRICKHYLEESSNVHRGVHHLSANATLAYEETRKSISEFIGSKQPEQIVFTKGSTESLNMIVNHFLLSKDDEILLTEMEHHSNIVPWLNLSKKQGCKVKFLPVLENGSLDLNNLDQYLNKKTKIFSFTYISNVLGTKNNVELLIKKAKEAGAITIIDAAQAMAHVPINVESLGCDFLVASAHKCFGPTGVGFLYAKKEHLEKFTPYQFGGAMIDEVTTSGFTLADIPHRFEAGTPNIAGVIGTLEAIKFIKNITFKKIRSHELELVNYAKEKLSIINKLKILGDPTEAIISFIIEEHHHLDIGELLDNNSVAIRVGHHCCQPLMNRLGITGSIRASFSVYNCKDDIDRLVEALQDSINLLANA